MIQQQDLQRRKREIIREEAQIDEDLHRLEKWRICRKQVCFEVTKKKIETEVQLWKLK
jgi:hypothetical protein